jgi:myo-inositol-1(or 4)-monophosphatase
MIPGLRTESIIIAAYDGRKCAAGRFDGFWELKLKPWDTAAGCLMVTEAGGAISDIAGGQMAFAVAEPFGK